MGLLTEDLYVFHGTTTAFDSVKLPGDEGFVSAVGQASGSAFYTFATTDPELIETVRDNARIFANDGMVLSGRAAAGSYKIIDGEAPLGDDLANGIRERLRATSTGNELLDRYYAHVADSLTADDRGRDAWGRIHGDAALKEWITETATQGLGDTNEIQGRLRQDRRALNAALEVHGIDGLGGLDRITPDQAPLVAQSLRELPVANPNYATAYSELADRVETGKIDRGGQIFEYMNRADNIVRSARTHALDGITLPEISVLDDHWVRVINKLDIAGISYKMDGATTTLFQGDVGIRQLPELRVDELHGHAPKDIRLNASPIEVGQVMLPQGGGRIPSNASPEPGHTNALGGATPARATDTEMSVSERITAQLLQDMPVAGNAERQGFNAFGQDHEARTRAVRQMVDGLLEQYPDLKPGDIRPLDAGSAAQVFQLGNDETRIVRVANAEREVGARSTSAASLQANHEMSIGDGKLRVEIMPRVIPMRDAVAQGLMSQGDANRAVADVGAAFALQGQVSDDIRDVNVGVIRDTNGTLTPVAFDPGPLNPHDLSNYGVMLDIQNLAESARRHGEQVSLRDWGADEPDRAIYAAQDAGDFATRHTQNYLSNLAHLSSQGMDGHVVINGERIALSDLAERGESIAQRVGNTIATGGDFQIALEVPPQASSGYLERFAAAQGRTRVPEGPTRPFDVPLDVVAEQARYNQEIDASRAEAAADKVWNRVGLSEPSEVTRIRQGMERARLGGGTPVPEVEPTIVRAPESVPFTPEQWGQYARGEIDHAGQPLGGRASADVATPQDTSAHYRVGDSEIHSYQTTGSEQDANGARRANPGQADSFRVMTSAQQVDAAALARTMDALSDASQSYLDANHRGPAMDAPSTTGQITAISQPNNLAGQFEIVTAARGDSHSSVVVIDAQNNVRFTNLIHDVDLVANNPQGEFGPYAARGENTISTHALTLAPGERAVVLTATDGLTDAYIGKSGQMQQEIQAYLRSNPEAPDVAKFLTERATALGSSDNITILSTTLDHTTQLRGQSTVMAVFDGIGHDDDRLSRHLAQQLEQHLPEGRIAERISDRTVPHVATRELSALPPTAPEGQRYVMNDRGEMVDTHARARAQERVEISHRDALAEEAQRRGVAPGSDDWGRAPQTARQAEPQPAPHAPERATTAPEAAAPHADAPAPQADAPAAPHRPGVRERLDRVGSRVGAATVALQGAAAVKAYREGDMDTARQHAQGAAVTAAFEAGFSQGGMRLGTEVAASAAERVGLRAAATGIKAAGGKIPVVGAFVGAAFGIGETGYEAYKAFNGESNWKKVGGTFLSGVAGTLGGIVGFGAGEVLQEGVHYGTAAAFGKENAARHSATGELIIMGAELAGVGNHPQGDWRARQAQAAQERQRAAAAQSGQVHSSFAGRAGAQHLNQELNEIAGQFARTNWGQHIGNGDRNVTAQELRQEMQQHGITVAEIDRNRDGNITGKEMTDALNAHGVQRDRGNPQAASRTAPQPDWRAEQARAAQERQRAAAAQSGQVHSSFAGRAGAQHLNAELKDLEGQATRGGWGRFMGNGDANVTVAEMRATMQKHGITVAEIDRNGDGNITGRELSNALQAHNVQKQPVRGGGNGR